MTELQENMHNIMYKSLYLRTKINNTTSVQVNVSMSIEIIGRIKDLLGKHEKKLL